MVKELTRRILRQVDRYHILTVDAVHQLYYPDASRDTPKRALNRLVGQGNLASFGVGKLTFYHLPTAKPGGTQWLWERYAVMVFCLLRRPEKRRLSPGDFDGPFKAEDLKSMPGISPAHQHYYVELTNHGRLGRAIVDSDAQPERAVRKCRETLAFYETIPFFQALLQDRAFVLSLLVAEESKAKEISATLSPDIATCWEFHAIHELTSI